MIKRFKYVFAPTWLPEPRNLRLGERNPNYLKSLAAGVISPFFHLPWIIFYTFLQPLFEALFKTVLFFIVSIWFGITGRAAGVRLVDVQVEQPSEEEVQAYIKSIFEGTGVSPEVFDSTHRKVAEDDTKRSVTPE